MSEHTASDPVSAPGAAAAPRRTQSKRVPRPNNQRGYIQVLEQRCKGCDLCIPACPVDIIEKAPPARVNMMGWIPVEVSDMKFCLGCNLCALVCPDQAIEVYKFKTPIPHAQLEEPA